MAIHYLLGERMLRQIAKYLLSISQIVPTELWCVNTIKKRNNDKLSQMSLAYKRSGEGLIGVPLNIQIFLVISYN